MMHFMGLKVPRQVSETFDRDESPNFGEHTRYFACNVTLIVHLLQTHSVGTDFGDAETTG
jgi:hypothetical protein